MGITEQGKLLMKVVKQNCELHYLMGRLEAADQFSSNEVSLRDAIDNILDQYHTMKGVDE